MAFMNRVRGRSAFLWGAISPKIPTSYLVDGPISHNDGLHKLTKGSAGAYSVSVPSAAEEGAILYITADTAFAHVVTVTGGIAGNLAFDICTLGGAIGDGLTLIASNQTWRLVASRNVVFT
jgi:hypothetical protein